jgi:hypothetical protein
MQYFVIPLDIDSMRYTGLSPNRGMKLSSSVAAPQRSHFCSGLAGTLSRSTRLALAAQLGQPESRPGTPGPIGAHQMPARSCGKLGKGMAALPGSGAIATALKATGVCARSQPAVACVLGGYLYPARPDAPRIPNPHPTKDVLGRPRSERQFRAMDAAD